MLTGAVLIGDKKLNLHLAYMEKSFIRKKLLNEIGAFVDITVKTRTVDDKENVAGMAMPDYSEYWAHVREEAGLQSDIVDLFFTGSMFASLTHKAGKDSVTSYFLSTVDKKGMSNPEKAYYSDEAFEFFGLNNQDRKDILKLVDEHAEKVIRGRK